MGAATISTLPWILLTMLIFVLPTYTSSSSPSTSRAAGFSSRIIHRNSPESPFYNPHFTRLDRIQKSMHHYYARQNYLQNSNSVRTRIWSEDSSYVMEYYIGTPKKRTYATLDTGSTLTWLQCAPCLKCYIQKTEHIFDPSNSSSYNTLTGDSPTCLAVAGHTGKLQGICQYELVYADGSSSSGDIAQETLHFQNGGEDVTFKNIIFGCGFNNTYYGVDDEMAQGIPGLIGLSRHHSSLISQLSYKRFSYCLGNIDDTKSYGSAKFGESAVITVHSSPMQFLGTSVYYNLALEGISVGTVRLSLPNNFHIGERYYKDGFLVDSGTTYTELRSSVFYKVLYELQKTVNMTEVKSHHCYYKGKILDISAAPKIMFHFVGLDMELPIWNTWEKMEDGSHCLAIHESFGFSILGSYQLQNFNVGYDLENQVVSIDPSICNGS